MANTSSKDPSPGNVTPYSQHVYVQQKKKKSTNDSLLSELATDFLQTTLPFWPIWGKRRDFTFSLHCKSWGRGSSTFLGHTLVQIYPEPPHTENILSPMWETRPQEKGKWEQIRCQEWNLAGLSERAWAQRQKTLLSLHSVFLLLEATWLYDVIIAEGITPNLPLSAETHQERLHRVLPPPRHYKQGFNVVPNKYIRKSLRAFQLMFLIPLASLLTLHRVPRNS